MANYKDFDEAMDHSLVPWGTMPYEQSAGVESVRHNLWATNRAVYKHIPGQLAAGFTALAAQIKAFRDGIQEDIFRQVVSVLQQPEFLGFNQTIQRVETKVNALTAKVDQLMTMHTDTDTDTDTEEDTNA